MGLKSIFMAAGILLVLNTQSAKADWGSSTKLATPALWPIAPHMFTCSLTNVTSTNHMIRIRIINGDGLTIKESEKVSLAGKHTKGLDIEGLPNGGGYMYCEFMVDGPKEWYRGVAKMYRTDGGDFIAVAAE